MKASSGHSLDCEPKNNTDSTALPALLSVTIVAQDEQRTVGAVLEAIKPIADEIIFVDSGSTDKTIEIARSHNVKFFHQDWLGYSAQKNHAIDLAQNEWILSLDADEVLTPELVSEIQKILAAPVPENVAGYRIPRVLYIDQTPVKRGGFYPDAQLRLFRKSKGRFRPRIVHESVEVNGDIIKLKNDMLHYAYKDVEQFAQAMDKYAQLSAQHYAQSEFKRWRVHPINELLHPLWTFFYRYIVRGGFLDGTLCLKLNLIYSDYVRKKISYLRKIKSTGL